MLEAFARGLSYPIKLLLYRETSRMISASRAFAKNVLLFHVLSGRYRSSRDALRDQLRNPPAGGIPGVGQEMRNHSQQEPVIICISIIAKRERLPSGLLTIAPFVFCLPDGRASSSVSPRLTSFYTIDTQPLKRMLECAHNGSIGKYSMDTKYSTIDNL